MKASPYSRHYVRLRAWLKEARLERGFTLREAAEEVGVHHSVLGKIEQDRRKIELIEYVKYCQALGADPHEGLDIIVKSLEHTE